MQARLLHLWAPDTINHIGSRMTLNRLRTFDEIASRLTISLGCITNTLTILTIPVVRETNELARSQAMESLTARVPTYRFRCIAKACLDSEKVKEKEKEEKKKNKKKKKAKEIDRPSFRFLEWQRIHYCSRPARTREYENCDSGKIMNYAAKRTRTIACTRCTSRLICHGARSLPSSCRDRLIDLRRTTPDLYADATTERNVRKRLGGMKVGSISRSLSAFCRFSRSSIDLPA